MMNIIEEQNWIPTPYPSPISRDWEREREIPQNLTGIENHETQFVAFREMNLTPKIENHETHFPKCKLVAFKELN